MPVHVFYLLIISICVGLTATAQVRQPPIGIQPVEVKDELAMRLKAVEDRLALIEGAIKVTPTEVTIEAPAGVAIKSNGLIRIEGHQSINMKSVGPMDLASGSTLDIKVSAGLRLKSGLPIVLNDRQRPVARLGDLVTVKSRFGDLPGAITHVEGSMITVP